MLVAFHSTNMRNPTDGGVRDTVPRKPPAVSEKVSSYSWNGAARMAGVAYLRNFNDCCHIFRSL